MGTFVLEVILCLMIKQQVISFYLTVFLLEQAGNVSESVLWCSQGIRMVLCALNHPHGSVNCMLAINPDAIFITRAIDLV